MELFFFILFDDLWPVYLLNLQLRFVFAVSYSLLARLPRLLRSPLLNFTPSSVGVNALLIPPCRTLRLPVAQYLFQIRQCRLLFFIAPAVIAISIRTPLPWKELLSLFLDQGRSCLRRRLILQGCCPAVGLRLSSIIAEMALSLTRGLNLEQSVDS